MTSIPSRPRTQWRFTAIFLAAVFSLGATASFAAPPDTSACAPATYRLSDDGVVDIAPSDPGTLRWRNLDGATGKLVEVGGDWTSQFGWTGRPDNIHVRLDDCAAGRIAFDGKPARRIPFDISETAFTSHGTRLVGRLVMPAGKGPVPVVILLHGAEFDSARDTNSLQRLLPAAGVGAFVYDKRGTGASGDKYTQDYSLLADDATAALAEAKRLAGKRGGRFGFQGPSQGGWVAPLAATRTNIDFVIVSFGLAVSVVDEDREAIAFQMGLKGYDANVIAKAQEIGDAATRVFESGMTDGIAELDTVRARYRGEPWYKDVYGNYTHIILAMSAEDIRTKGAQYRFGTPLRYDPMPTLRAVKVPQLWALGGMDIDAPSAETVRRLKPLIDAGHPITLALFPKAEHGMTEFEAAPDGTRLSTRYTPGYFHLLVDFAKGGKLAKSYGDADISSPPSD